jgi:hypothetical protein
MSKHVKFREYNDISSNYKIAYLPWPYLSYVEAQKPEIQQKSGFDAIIDGINSPN